MHKINIIIMPLEGSIKLFEPINSDFSNIHQLIFGAGAVKINEGSSFCNSIYDCKWL